MAKIRVLNNITLDGVMQAPGRPDEDTRDGFTHGGWAAPRGEAIGKAMVGQSSDGALLLGRQTYEGFFAFWPKQTNNPFTAALDNAQKYVVSTTLSEPLPWQNSTLLQGNPVDTVAQLKSQLDTDLLIMGSGKLIQSLMEHNLIDTFTLIIHPIVLGSGRRLFAEGMPPVTLKLVDSTTTESSAIIATYQLA